MGLFDRFKKRVKEVAEDVDSDALTAMEDSEEGAAALESSKHIEEDWEDDVPEIEEENSKNQLLNPRMTTGMIGTMKTMTSPCL